jgi:hypothetical protein
MVVAVPSELGIKTIILVAILDGAAAIAREIVQVVNPVIADTVERLRSQCWLHQSAEGYLNSSFTYLPLLSRRVKSLGCAFWAGSDNFRGINHRLIAGLQPN